MKFLNCYSARDKHLSWEEDSRLDAGNFDFGFGFFVCVFCVRAFDVLANKKSSLVIFVIARRLNLFFVFASSYRPR